VAEGYFTDSASRGQVLGIENALSMPPGRQLRTGETLNPEYHTAGIPRPWHQSARLLASCVVFLISFAVIAGEYAPPDKDVALEGLKTVIAEAAKDPSKVILWLEWFGKRDKAELVAADAERVSIRLQGNVFEQPWKKLSAKEKAALGKDCVQGKTERALAVADYCLATGQRRKTDELLHLASRCKPAMAEALAQRRAFFNGTAGASATNGAPRVKVPAGRFRDRIIGRDGCIDRSKYAAYALSVDATTIDHRLGPDYAFYHGDDKDAAPEMYQRHANGEYIWKQKGEKAKDWTGMGGQVLYVPQDIKDHGVDRIMFSWSFHQDHGASQFWHCYQLKPTNRKEDMWWTGSPDPCVKQKTWIAAAGGADLLRRPIAVARGKVSWSNCGIITFRNGVIGASGYGNNGDKYPCTKLAAGKVPMAVALTPNNEFALVAVWDVKQLKGQVAVVALEARSLAHHSWYYSGMPNVGTYTRLKVLGYVDLPAMVAPSAIAAGGNVSRWKWTTDVSKERLDQQAVRDKWLNQVDESHTNCTKGYAVVISRAESKAAFLDLAPLFQYFRKMYFTTGEAYAKTENEGPAPDQWPFTFEVAPEAMPKVVQTVELPQPTAVATGFANNDDRSMVSKAFIATLDGKLVTYDVGALISPKATTGVQPVGAVAIGRNPTCIATGRHLRPRNLLVITCRGDREVVWVSTTNKTATVVKRLRDARLSDPVCVEPSDTRGADVVTVADFKGRRLINYLHKPVNSWGEKLFGELGKDGHSQFECTGVLDLPGSPFLLSSAEVN
jgi:hypothetical protein